MVAKITTPSSVQKALNYNEKKVQKGVATCLFAGNFLKEANELNFYEKLHRFTDLIRLNCRAKTTSLHVSLNFDPSEKIGQETCIQIAATYMEKIGFGEQPYLVYEHRDAGHPHLHIVTTTIKEDGRRIDTYNIGKNQSQTARKDIEEAFGLVKAAGKNRTGPIETQSVAARKIIYGRADTKRSISEVLSTVINRYHYTSLPELNAVLKLYNLVADNGAEGSRIRQHGGLVYRVLDEKGAKVGVPVKASSLPFKPTLEYLQFQFLKGEKGRAPHKQKLKTTLDFTISLRPKTASDFVQRLTNEKVSVDLRKNRDGVVYGITFIDRRTGCVFNGSDIGKEYSIAGIQKRLAEQASMSQQPVSSLLETKTSDTQPSVIKAKNGAKPASLNKSVETESKGAFRQPNEILNDLLRPEQTTTNIPYGFKKKKKRRRGFNR